MLEIQASKIVNTVTFTVDKQSIAQAQAAANNLQKHFEKLANPKIRFQAQKQRRQKAREQIADSKSAIPKTSSDVKQQRIAEKAAKAQAREAAKIAKRNETADLKFRSARLQLGGLKRHCCKVSDEAAFCLIQRPYISKTLLTRRISPRGSP